MTVFSVASRNEDGTFQLFGDDGRVVHTDRDTVVEPGAVLHVGARLQAETEVRGTKTVAVKVMNTPEVTDLERATAIVRAMESAGFSGNVHSAVEQSRETSEPVEAILWRRFARVAPLYPQCLWEDAARQLGDMATLIGHDLTVEVPDDFVGMTEAVVRAANERLAADGDPRRFLEIRSCPDPDPVGRWLLATGDQYGALVDAGLIGAAAAQERSAAAPVALKVGMGKRIGAKFIDSLVCGITIFGFARWIGFPAAAVVGWFWFMTSDWSGSIGKKIFGLRVVDHETGRACSLTQSVLRNLPFLVGAPPGPAFASASLGFQALEIFTASRDQEGRRHGDRWAKTVVLPR